MKSLDDLRREQEPIPEKEWVLVIPDEEEESSEIPFSAEAELHMALDILGRVREIFFSIELREAKALLEPEVFKALLLVDKEVNDFLDTYEKE